MTTAFPFFLLSAAAFALWIAPGARFLLTVQEMGRLMEIEGFILWFCFMYFGFLGGTPGRPRESDPNPAGAIFVLLVVGFGLGGVVAHEFGGSRLLSIYVLSLLLHMLGAFRLQRHELQRESGTHGLAVLALVSLGFLAWLLVPLGDGKEYPAVFEGWFFRIGGQQLLAWACAYFALLGYLQMRKHRIFAHLREEAEQQSRDQTPR